MGGSVVGNQYTIKGVHSQLESLTSVSFRLLIFVNLIQSKTHNKSKIYPQIAAHAQLCSVLNFQFILAQFLDF